MTVVRVFSPGVLYRILVVVAIRLRRLDPATRARIERLYADLPRTYMPTASDDAQRTAAMAFVDGVLAIPDLRDEVEHVLQAGMRGPARTIEEVIADEMGLELRERIDAFEPRAAAVGQMPRMVPSSAGAEPQAAPTRSLKKAKPKKSSKKNGHPRPAAANGGGTRGGEEAAPEEERGGPEERAPLRRYPELGVPARMTPRVEASVTVGLRLEPREAGTAGVLIHDTGPEPPVIEVVLHAPGSEIVGSNTRQLTVARTEDVSVRFKIIPVREGPTKISVDFYQDDRRIGTVSAETVVGTGPLAVTAAGAPDLMEFAPPGATPPDLEILVEIDRQDPLTLHFTLHSAAETIGYHHARMGSIKLTRSPSDEIQLAYAELSKMAGKAPKTDKLALEQRERLAAHGRQLWERIFSKEMKDSYWDWRDKVHTVLITSEEPWMPWELVKPFRFDAGGQRVDDAHLSERFALTRWLRESAPADSFTVRSLQPVAPKTSDLAAVDTELRAFEQLTATRTGLTAAQRCVARMDVIRAFESGTFSILHVASHGSFDAAAPDNSAIKLSDGEVRPSDISVLFGGARARPIVFINACHGGRLAHTFTGIGGWADRLVGKARVAAFIGAAWEVNDRLALLFAARFYKALLSEGMTVGESFRLARTAIRDAEPSNSTWLAYVLYGDPGSRVAAAV